MRGIDFSVEKGEFVGYIGANGAGKSTTVKLLTGILHPSGGTVCCAGFDPYKRRYQYAYHIGVVLGQKSILEYFVPVRASFELYKKIYEMDEDFYRERVGFFCDLLKIDRYWDTPVRKLSFGERMRCEVAASLLHGPEIVFLDEPTIGLDAVAKEEIRNFLKAVNERDKTTVILTTHDMKDIESLCRRIMVIDTGSLIFDGPLAELRAKYLRERHLGFRLKRVLDESRYSRLRSEVIEAGSDGDRENWRLAQEGGDLADFVRALLESVEVHDFSLSEPELEEVIRKIYAGSNGGNPS